ncbi:imidazole glycerol phosphate synthase subunit HisH [candidate division KSB1 bacterium]|nr:imidazole glycerol phosphate synthase subunit HisH [candidate division KSB1 bacterium]
MITIIDYHAGNLFSVQKALEFLGAKAQISMDPKDIDAADKIIFPGVGSFGNAMHHVRTLGLEAPIKRNVAAGKPFLGICLGLQLLFESSEESPGVPGLDVLKGTVKRFDRSYKVPHLGWNQLFQVKKSPLWQGLPKESYFYFAHSYYIDPENNEIITGESDYHHRYTVAIRRDHLFGLQFHPEKSQKLGLRVLENFLNYKG